MNGFLTRIIARYTINTRTSCSRTTITHPIQSKVVKMICFSMSLIAPILLLTSALLPQASAARPGMSLPTDSEASVAALEPRADKSAECIVYGVEKYYLVRLTLTNWEHDKSGSAKELEPLLKKHCGAENVDSFRSESRGPKASYVQFRIPRTAWKKLGDPPDASVQDAVYDYSGTSKIRVKCKHPAL